MLKNVPAALVALFYLCRANSCTELYFGRKYAPGQFSMQIIGDDPLTFNLMLILKSFLVKELYF